MASALMTNKTGSQSVNHSGESLYPITSSIDAERGLVHRRQQDAERDDDEHPAIENCA